MKTRKGEPVIVVPEEQQQLVELERRIGELEAERKLLIKDFRDRCERVIEVRTERDNWQKTARQAYRNVDYYRGLVVSIGELFGLAARTSDDGSIQDDVLCAKVPELCTAMSGERDQLAAECGLLREVLEMIAKIKLNESDPAFIGICPMRIGFLRPVHMSKVKEALATTPHAAKAAERVRKLEVVAKAAREADTLLTNYLANGRLVRGGDGEEVRDMLRDALDRLDALDKPEVQG